ncbi:MAG: alpha/beta hydrolase [Coxiellaceae bacterium]|nr:alpha/beta hydrolase [Coxiellaceae bacterium]
MLQSQGTVILLHGISRSSRIMSRLESALQEAGYTVRNIDYPSVTYSLNTLAQLVVQKIQPDIERNVPLHFVGHSMGAIVTRLIIRDHRPKNLGRVVMIAPPNKGSTVADFMQRFKFYRKLFGPAGQQIGANLKGVHHDLPPADYECGVIAGNRSADPWFSWLLYRGHENDGKVSVEQTKLDGMKDFVVVPVAHAALASNEKVIDLVKTFLSSGHF